MNKPNPELPKKFQKSKKSSLKKLFVQSNQSHGSSFLPFPRQVDFYGKDTDEDIVLIVRSHWIAYVPSIAVALFVLLVPLIFLAISYTSPFIGKPVLYIGMLVVAFVIASNIVVTTIAKWFYTVNIITDQRVVVIKMQNALSHSYAEAQLEKIEDVTHTNIGILSTIFDIGNIDIDTAGHQVDFKLTMLPRPRDIQDVLNDLLEMKQKGEI